MSVIIQSTIEINQTTDEYHSLQHQILVYQILISEALKACTVYIYIYILYNSKSYVLLTIALTNLLTSYFLSAISISISYTGIAYLYGISIMILF